MADNTPVAEPAVTDVDTLAARLAGQSVTWLDPAAPGSRSLAGVLETATADWPDPATTAVASSRSTLLFPMPYSNRATLSPLVFHQLIDAVCEARRTGRTVALLAVPTGRGGPRAEAGQTIRQIASAFTGHGFQVDAAGDASEQAGGRNFADRAATSAFTRRHVDLPDLLIAAAADALGSDQVCLSAGLRPGRNLAQTGLLVPLARLHHPADPFAAVPPGAKRPPAGTDSLWATAFTLGLTHQTRPAGTEQPGYLEDLGSCLRPLWNELRRRQLTGQRPAPGTPPLRIACGRHQQGTPVAVPLFGAPDPSVATTSLITAAACAGPPVLIVDDLTPRWSYPQYALGQVRDRYEQLARRRGGSIMFVSDLPGLDKLLQDTMTRFTLDDLRTAVGPRSSRSRGSLTGWDAVHLAVMSVACTASDTPTIAVRAANLRQVTTLAPDAVTLAITGTFPGSGGTATVPVSWINPPRTSDDRC